jgi:hypothetical protein
MAVDPYASTPDRTLERTFELDTLPAEASPGALARAATSTDLAAIAGPAREAVTYDVDQNDLVSGQLNRILSSGSPYIDRARTRAASSQNARGTLASSMAAGAGEAAAIDAALPIAQGDANTYFTARRENAGAQNQFGMDENRFMREGALSIMGERFRADDANANRAAREREFNADLGLRTEQVRLENARVERELGLREGTLQLERERTAEEIRRNDSGMLADLQRTYMDARLQLETSPNLDADGKARAINAMSDWFMGSVLGPMRETLGNPDLWPDFEAPSRYIPPPPPPPPPPNTDDGGITAGDGGDV